MRDIQKNYANKTYLDFSNPEIDKAQKDALATVRSQFGKTYDLYVNGTWVKGDKGTFESINPSNTSEVIGHFQMASAKQAKQALSDAWEAFKTWQYVPVEERAEYLYKMAELIEERRYEINAWMISESGKNYLESDADLCEAIDFLNYYANEAIRLDKGMEVIDSWGDINRTIYIPLGAGVSISPWNFPFAICFGMAFAPIVAGNTVVAKPAPDTPMMGYLIAKLADEVGLPKGVFNFITGDNIEVGETLTTDPSTRFITFTGSKNVGLHINEIAAKVQPGQKFIKRMVCELGGKNAIIVDKNADLEAAATGIVQAAFGFQGQKCSACSRAIVLEEVYEEVLAKVVAKTKALNIGDAKDNPNVTPVVNQKAVDKILYYIELGKQEATLVHGGKRAEVKPEGFYVEPTIFRDVPPTARIAQEEIFGPVVGFIKVKDIDEALQITNDTEFGLTGGFFSNDPATLEKAYREHHVGNLYINRKNTGALVGAQPFGGFNMSGTDGKAGGKDYLLYFLQAKAMTERPMKGVPPVLENFKFTK
ncbi:L-glutamate gamma-semialdehyde dehydrogenase [bacterium]|nr:MAG: L-glutamate gamma-semialdehyde dehydrogenase [bacterium]